MGKTIKVVSPKRIIATVFRDFRPMKSDWTMDAMEWIGEALCDIGYTGGYVMKQATRTLSNYSITIDCDIDDIQAIEYEGCKVNIIRPTKGDNFEEGGNTNITCWIYPNYIKCNRDGLKLKIHYLSLPTDCDGFPMVPDNQLCDRAIAWYILSKIIGRGDAHPVYSYQDAINNYEKYYPIAQNDMSFPTVEDYSNFVKNWTSTVFDINRADKFFRDDYYTGQMTYETANTLYVADNYTV